MVDSRTLQANERTLLAWVRTSISLMTFGFVIAKIGIWLPRLNTRPDLHASPQLESTWVGGVFLVLGVVANALAVTRYSLARRAILTGKQVGAGPLPMIMAVLVTLFGIVISVYMLRHLF
jgi:putative membrane protein